MNENFTKGTLKILKYAKEEAIRLGHTYVGSEHLLLGIIKDSVGNAATTSSKVLGFDSALFLRKNFAVTEKSTWGIGAFAARLFPGNDDARGVTKSFAFAPYSSMEYALNSRLHVMASIRPVLFNTTTTEVGTTTTKQTTTQILAGSNVQLAYLFN